MKTGVELIAAERERQIFSEHWSARHDDRHEHGELARAARAYALPGIAAAHSSYERQPPSDWPWEVVWWKPSKNSIRNLVKAGALIAAEIDRLQRQEKKGGGQ